MLTALQISQTFPFLLTFHITSVSLPLRWLKSRQLSPPRAKCHFEVLGSSAQVKGFRLGICPTEEEEGGTGSTYLLPSGIKMYIVAMNNQAGRAVPCDSACFQMARRVSPPFLHRRVGFASPPLPTNLMRMLRSCFSGAGCSLSAS